MTDAHQFQPAWVSDLRAGMTGRVVTARDDEYEALRAVIPGGVDRRPIAIARPAGAADVAAGIAAARNAGAPLAVRGGGHSSAVHGVIDDGLVLDMRDIRHIDIDAGARTAWAGAGLTAGEYSSVVGARGLATGFGDTGSVGIGGITLGGGVGYLTRKYGMTIDNVLAAEVVVASGETLVADASSHPDLFWAIRGGGGNFGVVTRFQYRLAPVDRVVGGMLMLPATIDAITGVIDAAERATEDLSIIVNVMPAPPMPFVPEAERGKLCVLVLACCTGDEAAATAAIDSIRAVATPIVDMVRPMAYPELFPPDDPSYRPKAVGQTMFMRSVDRVSAETMIGFLERSDASLRVVQLRVLGGAMARVPADATAYAHRHCRIMTYVAALYEETGEKADREAWVRACAAALDQGEAGAYVNFLGNEGDARVRSAYPGATWDRLTRIKARYDPANLFRSNQNVTPD